MSNSFQIIIKKSFVEYLTMLKIYNDNNYIYIVFDLLSKATICKKKNILLHQLIKKSKTKTGAKAGVTREQQWVRINPKVDLLDTPGIIPLKQENQTTAYKLAFVDSIGENAYDVEAVAQNFINTTEKLYPDLIKKYYNLNSEEVNLSNIALKRNWILQGGKPDTKRCAQNILNDFRSGRLGRLTLDIDE